MTLSKRKKVYEGIPCLKIFNLKSFTKKTREGRIGKILEENNFIQNKKKSQQVCLMGL